MRHIAHHPKCFISRCGQALKFPVRTDSGLVWDSPAVAGKYMVSYGKRMWLGQMSPTHTGFFVPFWNHIWTLVRILLVTDLEISGLICNLQGCSGCFGKHCIYKSSIDCTERYSFFGVLLGLSAVLVLSHHPMPLVQSPQVKSSRSASIGSAPS